MLPLPANPASPVNPPDLFVSWYGPEHRIESPEKQIVTAIRDDEMAICGPGTRPVDCGMLSAGSLIS